MRPPDPSESGAAPNPPGPEPALSVIMPVLNGRGVIEQSIAALDASTLAPERWELLIVDDGSTDDTGDYVRGTRHRLLSVDDGPLGPAAARNRGSTLARAGVLVFVDADVRVHSDALERFLRLFDADPELGAAFGAYDDEPDDPAFLSQYRNLYHRYVHLRGAGEAETFWAGCGAVRSAAFRQIGGFDAARFPRPQIEDIELGYRLRDAGWSITLDPHIQASHMKRWGLRGMLRTDLFDRGVPWMRLLLARPRADRLNVRTAERARTALVGLACLCAAAGAATLRPGIALAALLPLTLLVVSNVALYRWFAETRGAWFAIRVIPLNILLYLVSGLAVVIASTAHLVSGPEAWSASTVAGPSAHAPVAPKPGPATSNREAG